MDSDAILIAGSAAVVLAIIWQRLRSRKKHKELMDALHRVEEQTLQAKEEFERAYDQFSIHRNYSKSTLVPFDRDSIVLALRAYGYASACLYYDDKILIPVYSDAEPENRLSISFDRLHVLTLNSKTGAMAFQTYGLEVVDIDNLLLEPLLEAVTRAPEHAFGLEDKNNRKWLTISSYMVFPADICIVDRLLFRIARHSRGLADGFGFCLQQTADGSALRTASTTELISRLGFVTSYLQDPVETLIEQ